MKDRPAPGSRFRVPQPQGIVNAKGPIRERLSPGIGIRIGGRVKPPMRHAAWFPTERRSKSSRCQLDADTSIVLQAYSTLNR
jgi:hypothetical protein